MAEALEKWPVDLFMRLLPRVYQIVEEINRRFLIQVEEKYPNQYDKIRNMAILYEGQVRMANMAIIAGFSVNGVARLHTQILEERELHDFYEMMPEKFNNKTNGITQRRFLLHANPLLAQWVTDKLGTDEWITNLPLLKGLAPLADDSRARKEFQEIKYQNKLRLAKYIKEHNGIDINPDSIFDVQVKRLHEYKRQLMNIMHIMYLYNQLKDNPNMSMYLGAKAAVENFTRVWAMELAADGVRVNAIAPGTIATDIWNQTDLSEEDAKAHMDNIISMIPLCYVGASEDIANAAAYLASEQARYVTGAILAVDGGMGAS